MAGDYLILAPQLLGTRLHLEHSSSKLRWIHGKQQKQWQCLQFKYTVKFHKLMIHGPYGVQCWICKICEDFELAMTKYDVTSFPKHTLAYILNLNLRSVRSSESFFYLLVRRFLPSLLFNRQMAALACFLNAFVSALFRIPDAYVLLSCSEATESREKKARFPTSAPRRWRWNANGCTDGKVSPTCCLATAEKYLSAIHSSHRVNNNGLLWFTVWFELRFLNFFFLHF